MARLESKMGGQVIKKRHLIYNTIKIKLQKSLSSFKSLTGLYKCLVILTILFFEVLIGTISLYALSIPWKGRQSIPSFYFHNLRMGTYWPNQILHRAIMTVIATIVMTPYIELQFTLYKPFLDSSGYLLIFTKVLWGDIIN